MQYETIGGAIKDTDRDRTILRNLRYGDRFANKQGKGLWEVRDDKCRWSSAGSSTRKCKNLITGQIEFKLCRIEVVKRT